MTGTARVVKKMLQKRRTKSYPCQSQQTHQKTGPSLVADPSPSHLLVVVVVVIGDIDDMVTNCHPSQVRNTETNPDTVTETSGTVMLPDATTMTMMVALVLTACAAGPGALGGGKVVMVATMAATSIMAATTMATTRPKMRKGSGPPGLLMLARHVASVECTSSPLILLFWPPTKGLPQNVPRSWPGLRGRRILKDAGCSVISAANG